MSSMTDRAALAQALTLALGEACFWETEDDEAEGRAIIVRVLAEHETALCKCLRDLPRYESEEIEGSQGYFVDWDDIAELLGESK